MVTVIVAVNGVDVAAVDVLALLDVVAIAGATLAEALAPTAAWSADTVADRLPVSLAISALKPATNCSPAVTPGVYVSISDNDDRIFSDKSTLSILVSIAEKNVSKYFADISGSIAKLACNACTACCP